MPSFYFWKSNQYYLSEIERQSIQDLSVQKMYVKFFEVASDEVLGNKPIAKSILNVTDCRYTYDVNDSLYCACQQNMAIIPTVYLHNEALKDVTKEELDQLADNINFLIRKYFDEHFSTYVLPLAEIQMDCDWTPSTQENYYYLLTKIKELSGLRLSCTLRLYPYKYPENMGVPPVDRVMLMCYNLFNPLDRINENSILNNDELELYLKSANDYPLQLDIALPIYSWMFLYQNKKFKGTLPNDLTNLDSIATQIDSTLTYLVQKDTVIGQNYLRRGDVIKRESVEFNDLKKTIKLLKKYIPMEEEMTIALFHLDNTHIQKMTHEELNDLFQLFSK